MRETPVVTAFLMRPGPAGPRLLLLRRSARVGSYRGRWAAVSGYLEGEPLQQALREIEEETGLGPAEVRLLRRGPLVAAPDPGLGRRWLVHPFLFEVVGRRPLRLDWEHVEARWVRPESVFRYPTVPRLPEALQAVYPLAPEQVASVASEIAEDRRRGARELAGLALEALSGVAREEPGRLRASACLLARARPGMPGIAMTVAHAYREAAASQRPAAALQSFLRKMEAAREGIVRLAREVLPRDVLLTYSRSSLVLAALLALSPRRAIISEGRPLGEGVALAQELAGRGIAVTLVTEAQLAAFVGEAQAVLVGADALFPDGGFLNKVGTRLLALAARVEGIPLYVLADTLKVLPPSLARSPALEEGDPAEVLPAAGPGIEARNLYFEATPGRLVTAYLTEDGLLRPSQLAPYARRAREALHALFGRGAPHLA